MCLFLRKAGCAGFLSCLSCFEQVFGVFERGFGSFWVFVFLSTWEVFKVVFGGVCLGVCFLKWGVCVFVRLFFGFFVGDFADC